MSFISQPDHSSISSEIVLTIKIVEHLEFQKFTFSQEITVGEARHQIGEETETDWEQFGLFLPGQKGELGKWLLDEHQLKFIIPQCGEQVYSEYKPRFRYIKLYLNTSKAFKSLLIDDTARVEQLLPFLETHLEQKDIVDPILWTDTHGQTDWAEEGIEILSPKNTLRDQGFIGDISIGICKGRKSHCIFINIPHQSGFLLRKKAGIFKGIMNPTWVRKYYFLQRDRLFFFKDNYKTEEEGSISVQVITSVSKTDKDIPSEFVDFAFEISISDKKIVLIAVNKEERDEWIHALKQGVEMFTRETKFYKSQITKDSKLTMTPLKVSKKGTSNPLSKEEVFLQKEKEEISKLLEIDDDDFTRLDLLGDTNIHENAYDDVAMELLLWEEENQNVSEIDLTKELESFDNTKSRSNTPTVIEIDHNHPAFESVSQSSSGQSTNTLSLQSTSQPSSFHSSPSMGLKSFSSIQEQEKRRSQSHGNPSFEKGVISNLSSEEQEKRRSQSHGNPKSQSTQSNAVWKSSISPSQREKLLKSKIDSEGNDYNIPLSILQDENMNENNSNSQKTNRRGTRFESTSNLSFTPEISSSNILENSPVSKDLLSKNEKDKNENTLNDSSSLPPSPLVEKRTPLSSFRGLNKRTSVRFLLTQNPEMFQKFKEITGGSTRSFALKLTASQKTNIIHFFNTSVPEVITPLDPYVDDHQLEKEFFRHILIAFPVAKYFGATENGSTPTLPEIIMGWVHWTILTSEMPLPEEYKKPTQLSKDFKSGIILTLLTILISDQKHLCPQYSGSDLDRTKRALETIANLECPQVFDPETLISGNPLITLYLLTSLFYIYFPKQEEKFEHQVALPRETLCGLLNYLFHYDLQSDIDPLNCYNIVSRLRDGKLLCQLINNTFFDKPQIKIDPDTDGLKEILTYGRGKGIFFPVTNQEKLKDDFQFLTIISGVTTYCLKNRLSYQKYPEMSKFLPPSKYEPSPEEKLISWINYQTKNNIKNLSEHLSDGKVLLELITKLFPESCISKAQNEKQNNHTNQEKTDSDDFVVSKRCKQICQALQTTLELRIPPLLIKLGNPSLSLLFLILIFQYRPSLGDQDQLLNLILLNEQRKERSLRVWINSFQLDKRIKNLLENLTDLKLFIPLFSAVFSKKQLQSCPLDNNEKIFEHLTKVFDTLGIANDITSEEFFNNPQKSNYMFHKIRSYDISHFREKLLDPNFSDQDLIEWANNSIKKAKKENFAKSLDDPTLSNGKFFIDLLYSLQPQSVSYSLVTEGNNFQQQQLNAKYVISITWKIGVNVFLVWEDIVERNILMILAFLCSLVVNFANDQVRTLPSTFQRNALRRFQMEDSPFIQQLKSSSLPLQQKGNQRWVSPTRKISDASGPIVIGHKEKTPFQHSRALTQISNREEKKEKDKIQHPDTLRSQKSSIGLLQKASNLIPFKKNKPISEKEKEKEKEKLIDTVPSNEIVQRKSELSVSITVFYENSSQILEIDRSFTFKKLQHLIQEKWPNLQESFTVSSQTNSFTIEITEKTFDVGAFLNGTLKQIYIASI